MLTDYKTKYVIESRAVTATILPVGCVLLPNHLFRQGPIGQTILFRDVQYNYIGLMDPLNRKLKLKHELMVAY